MTLLHCSSDCSAPSIEKDPRTQRLAHSQSAKSPASCPLPFVQSPKVSPIQSQWVDPNELHIDLTKIARHRHLRRSTDRLQQGDSPSPGAGAGVLDKRQHRAERSRRIQALALAAAQREVKP